MPTVRLRDQTVLVGSKQIPLISGEVHYWRLNPARWPQILKQVKASGLSVISTYVPWEYHEYERGQFDFTGATEAQRDLTGFLELTRKEKLWLIIRPGPYIYSEWPQDGVPLYAHQYHRLHPQFLSWAKDYLGAVTEAIRPYLATQKNGHIILLQADNEIDPWPDRFGAQYGLGVKPGLFQDFLSAKYKNKISRLNDVWAGTYRNFNAAKPFFSRMVDTGSDWPRGYPLKGFPELRRHLDFLEFKHDYARRYARVMVDMYRKLDIDVPIFLNTYPFFYAHRWHDLAAESDFIGVDVYSHNEFREYPTDHRRTTDKLRYAREVSPVAFISEFGAGVWHSEHYKSGVMTPNHYRLASVSALAAGMTGWNWYMFVNRDNWYMSPLNEWGRARPELLPVFEAIIKAAARMEPWRCKKLSNVGATYNTMQYAAKAVSREGGTLQSLYEADIDYRLFDPEHNEIKTRILFYSGADWISTKAHQNLRAFVHGGGTLIAFQEWPRKDDSFKTNGRIGFEEPEGHLFEFKKGFRLVLGKQSVEMVSSVMTFRSSGPGRMYASFGDGYGTLCVGYIKKVGRGRLIHLGVTPSPELIHALLNYLRVPIYSYALTPHVQTALFMRGRRLFMTVTHNGLEDNTAVVSIPYLSGRKKKCKLQNLFSDKIEAEFDSRGPVASFPIKAKNAVLFEIL